MGFSSGFSALLSPRKFLRKPWRSDGASSFSAKFRVENLLRRDSLEVASRALTVMLSLICVIFIALTARELITTRLLGSKLGNKVDSSRMNLKLASAAANQTEATETTASDLSALSARSVFGALSAASTTRANPPAVVAKDPLILIGTFVTGGEAPYAIIEDDKKKIQDVFAVGETVFGDGTVKRIFVDRVEVERGGQIEILLLDDDSRAGDDGGPSTSAGGDLVVVQEAEYTQALDNLPLLLTQARAVPYFKDGKAQGLRLFAVKAGSFYERLGLKNGDVLKSINENSLADLSQAMQLLEKLKTERSFSISVERNSEPKELKYEIR